MPKASLRKTMLEKRRALQSEASYSSSLRIQQSLVNTAEFRRARSVGLYSSILNEVFTEEIFHAARAAGKSVFYPRVVEDILEFAPVTGLDDLRPGAFGILEPGRKKTGDGNDIELIVVPGIAFDRLGHRLGFGRGFYDRVLHGLTPLALRIGLAYDWQIVESLPYDAHDVRMNLVVTETETIRTGEPSPAITGHMTPDKRRCGP